MADRKLGNLYLHILLSPVHIGFLVSVIVCIIFNYVHDWLNSFDKWVSPLQPR